LYIWARFTILNFGGTGNLYRSENVFTQNISARFFTFMTVVLEFFKLIFWPEKIHMEKGIMMPIYTSFWHWPVIAGFILFCGLIGAVVMAMIYKIVIPAKAGMQGLAVSFEKTVDSRFRGNDKRDDGNDKQKASVVVFGILWFLFGLVPVSNVLIPISTIMEDNWLYHSVIGLFFIIAFFAFHLYFNGKKSVKIFLAALFVILAGACMGRTIRQNRVWKDPITFYEYTLKHVPQSGRFRNNLAMAYAEENRYHDAIEQYQSAIQLEDRYSETHHNLGNAYLAVGRFTEAEREFYRAIEMRPGFFHSYLALASLYDQFKRDDLTIRILQKLLQNVPERWESYYYLGHIYFLEGEKQKARDLWQRGLLIDPYNKMLQEALKK
jgi:Flp pilus assembly protein TadD